MINKAGHKVYDKFVIIGDARLVLWVSKNK